MQTVPLEAPPRRLLGVLFLGTFLGALDIAVVGPALPALAEAFSLDARAVAWTFTAFVLANLAGLPIMAALADRIGRRTVYLTDIAIFAAGTTVVVFAPSFEVLLAGRVIQGLGTSGIFPVASAVIGDVYPPESRGRAVGLLGSVFGAAFLVGPAMGGIVLAFASWRWLFEISLPLAALVFVLSARSLPRSESVTPRPFDALGTVTLTSFLAVLVVGLSGLATSEPWLGVQGGRVGGAFAVAAVLLGLFVWAERRAPAPLIRPGLLARRPVQLACALAVGAGRVEATFVLLSDYTVTTFGVEPSRGSYLLLPLVAGVTVGAPVAGRLLDRVGARPGVTVAALLIAVGMGVVTIAPSLGVHIAGTVVLGLGLSGILGSSLSYILLSESSADERAVAQGRSTIFFSVVLLAGAALLAALAASATTASVGYRTGFGVVAGTGLLLALLGLGLRRKPS